MRAQCVEELAHERAGVEDRVEALRLQAQLRRANAVQQRLGRVREAGDGLDAEKARDPFDGVKPAKELVHLLG
jgi:hypothetical protein